MLMGERMEIMRQLIDMAVSSGRKRQSSQTGFVHHFYHQQEEDVHLTIPLIENFLFALALLKTRTIENITEAKSIVERLLHFQNKEIGGIAFGNFPIYIHEFPVCNDRFTGLQIGVIIYWTLKQFSSVLGSDLKKRLEETLTFILQHAIKTHSEKAATYPNAIKIACLLSAAGDILQRQDFVKEGVLQLEKLRGESDRIEWCCPATMGTMLSSLLMVYPRLSASPWIDFWEHLNITWHRHTCTYVGPAMKEWQSGEEPQVTLYDLFMGYLQGGLSKRIKQEGIVHLEAALISAMEDTLEELQYPLQQEWSNGSQKYCLYQSKLMAFCFIENHQKVNPISIKGYHPLRFVWGSSERVHTFVCQGGNVRTLECIRNPQGVDLVFELGDVMKFEDREGCRETIFFMDVHDDVEMLISGQKATTFSLGEELTIQSGEFKLSLIFHLQEGDGRFLGHRMLGNRPSQLMTKGKQRYQAYDWQIFMRTIQRSDLCIVRASLFCNG